MKKQQNPSFADTICDVRIRKVASEFFDQINILIDWGRVSKIIDRYDRRGRSAVGKPNYDGLLLFKMCLLQTWYGLSDYQVEERINDSISFSRFCGLNLEQIAPDHSTLSRFRTAMTNAGAYEKLLKEINRQLEKHKIIVKTGAIVDASVIDTPLKPKGKVVYEVSPGSEEVKVKVNKVYPESVDQEASWVKKGGRLRYGYKKHYVSDDQGLVLGVVTTKASLHEATNLKQVLNAAKLPKGIPLKADKGYQSQKNEELLRKRNLKNHILKKATKNNPLTHWQKEFNKIVGKTRYKIERTFGSIKRWFGGGVARYRGLQKMHTQNLLEALCYNLYRSPGRIASNNQKK